MLERSDVAFRLLEIAKSHKPNRSSGWHASDHIRCLRKSIWTKLTGRETTDAEDLDRGSAYRTELLFIKGEGIGSFYEEHQAEYIFGVPDFGTCSVDRLWQEDETTFLMELKSTDMSAGYAPTEEGSATNGYIMQIATYLVKHLLNNGGVETDKKYKCFIYVFYNHGDYLNNDRRPDHRAFEIRLWGWELLQWEEELQKRHGMLEESWGKFQEAEKDTYNAGQIERMRDLLPTHGIDLESLLPPVSQHWAYECETYSRCPLKDLIDCPGTKNNSAWSIPFEIEKEEYARNHRVRKGSKK